MSSPGRSDDKLPRCRICGHEGHDVSSGIYRTRKDRYVTILRCTDHAACEERRAAI